MGEEQYRHHIFQVKTRTRVLITLFFPVDRSLSVIARNDQR